VPTPPAPPGAPSPAVEGRAIWVSRFEYDSPARVAEIMERVARANFNIVYFQVRGAADAFYRSAIEPCAAALCGRLGGTPAWDPLEVAVREAHARGLELHPWLNALTAIASGSAASCATLAEPAMGQPRHLLLEHPDWVVVDAAARAQTCPNAEEYVWLSPGVPGVRTRLAAVAADIARRYAVDGIHLDRIRYPGPGWSYDQASLRAFGRDPASDPAGWAQFRRDLVAAAVRETRDSLRAARPSAVLSAAVWGIWRDRWGWRSSEGYGQYLQDPRAWAAEGTLDVAVPMTYFAIAAEPCGVADWACLLADHLAGVRGATGRAVHIGIAANRGSSEVVRQVALGRVQGVNGFAVYSYGAAASAGVLDTLRAGPFGTRARAR
jgi:uncharacterized lipoprotein YddW (UPF0748 family)